jgi:hypothetical protein
MQYRADGKTGMVMTLDNIMALIECCKEKRKENSMSNGTDQCDHGNVNTVGWGIDANGQAFVLGGCPECGEMITVPVVVVAAPEATTEASD